MDKKARMKYLFSIGLLFTAIQGIKAQPALQWQRCFGGTQYECPFDLQATQDGGCVGVGISLSSNGDVGGNFGVNDIWVVKINSEGQLEWETNLGGSKDERGYTVLATEDNGYLVGGFTESNDTQVSGNHGDKDGWIVKLNAFGVLLWQKCYGGSKSDIIQSICKTSDGGYLVAAESGSSDGDVPANFGGSDYWIFKMDSEGQILWSKNYGGSNQDQPYCISVKEDGFIYVAGKTSSVDGNITAPKGGEDTWVLKLNNSGDLVWQKSLGGSTLDYGTDIVHTPEGEILILSTVYSSNGDVTGHHGGMDIWIAALNQAGELQWQKSFGGSADDSGQAMVILEDLGIAIMGTTESTNGDVIGNDGGIDFWIIKVDSDGNLLWQKSMGGTLDETGQCIVQLTDGGIAITGRTRSNNGDISGNHGSSDFWVAKFAPETSSTQTPAAIPLNLYPNPATQWITLNLPIIEQNMQVSITDEQGRLLQTRSIRTDEKLDIAALPLGVYWVSAVSKSGQVYAGKFVKG
ncbi:MAG TPA: T9SS type A sorting domain-containing protein [Saprospiraceae bacterium]|nr:T9SS type A sorting domain-containing protein [Saprospiraceae bacterium]